MKAKVTIEADTEEERIFMEQIAQARNEALANDLSQEQVARMLTIFAQGLLSPSFDEQGVSSVEEEKTVCPSCGSILEEVEFRGIGQDPVVVPCGCSVEYDDLPQEVLDEL